MSIKWTNKASNWCKNAEFGQAKCFLLVQIARTSREIKLQHYRLKCVCNFIFIFHTSIIVEIAQGINLQVYQTRQQTDGSEHQYIAFPCSCSRTRWNGMVGNGKGWAYPVGDLLGCLSESTHLSSCCRHR